MKIRIKFSKYGNMKFIGHLDTMRYFQKVMRRAGIDIAYSSGFSPHQIMSFAAPLGVGIESEGEYVDIEVNSTYSTAEAVQKLNEVMVEGYVVNDYRLLPDQSKPAMSIVSCADYTLTYRKGYELDLSIEQLQNAVCAFYEDRDSILIVKKTKKSEKEIDLKPLIYSFEVRETDHAPSFYLKVSTGSTDNIKPELVMEHFYHFLGKELKEFTFQTLRHDVYTGNPKDGFCSLNDCGTVIV